MSGEMITSREAELKVLTESIERILKLSFPYHESRYYFGEGEWKGQRALCLESLRQAVVNFSLPEPPEEP